MTDDHALSKRVFTRTAIFQSLVLIGILVVLGFGVRQQVRQVYIESLSSELSDMVEVIYKLFPNTVDSAWCRQTADQTQLRLSVISAVDGKVVCDNAYALESLPPLLDRPEVQAALESTNHRGKSVRQSRFTKDLERTYVAIHSPERQLILRGGLALSKLQEALTTFDHLFLGSILFASLTFAFILLWSARRIGYVQATQLIDQSKKRMQKDFVANVSHEFRTPLASIRGFASTIQGDLKSGRSIDPEFVEIIVKDSDRLLGLVNDLLDLSALDSGSLQIQKENVAVQEITEEVLKRLEIVYAAKRPVIKTHYGVETVHADPERLMQILINLVGNSLNHCPVGSAIEIAWDQIPGFVRCRVSDNGPGIPASAQSKVFDRFVRVNEKGVKNQGTGLGLPIVKELVQTHRGEITLESKLGEGTRFTVCFPTETIDA